jgi:hypothetical protein
VTDFKQSERMSSQQAAERLTDVAYALVVSARAVEELIDEANHVLFGAGL